MTSVIAVERRRIGALLALLACGLCASARAASGDTNSDPGKVFRAKGYKPPVPGGAVIVDASGNRLEIVPSRRPAPENSASASPKKFALPVLPALPTLDDPKAGLGERRRRAQLLLAGSASAAFLLVFWARRRWRPDV